MIALVLLLVAEACAFQHLNCPPRMNQHPPSGMRRTILASSSGGIFGSLFGGGGSSSSPANASAGKGGFKPTNEIVKVVKGMRHRRLGGSDIVVSEMGLGTQRW